MKSLQLDLSNLVTAIVLIAVFAMAVRVPISPDMWWHLRCGQVQWQTKSVIQSDLFSHTAHGTPWVNQSWLPQLMMYGLYALGGLPALALSVAALVAATFGFVLATAQSKGRYDTFWRAFVVLWAAISTGRVWAARPHLTTFLLTAVWTCLLDRQRRKGDGVGVLAWLPPLMAVWANCHGGYVVGFLLLGAEIGGRILDALWQRQIEGLWTRLRPLLLVTVLVALAALLNPQGLRLLLFPFQTLGSYAQQQYVAEWASPDFHAVDLLPFLALLLATWSAAALGERRIAGGELLRLLGFTAMSLRSGRYLGLCAVVIAPILISRGALAMTQLGKHWGRPHIASSPARGSPVLNWALLILILIAAGIKVAMPLSAQTIDLAQQRFFPVQAVAYMRTHSFPPTLFNEYGWGGYLIWSLYPGVPVFIDGRADPYGDELIAAYRRAISGHLGWEAVLQDYGVRTVLIPFDSALASILRESKGWEQAYADDMAVIFIQDSLATESPWDLIGRAASASQGLW